ncbi:MAG TPA: hypothetical protein PKY29_09060 [Ferruginibacter sp.]|nr:hypothetical protein [Ferruginibacter sp.]HRO18024.1 hypothetical protein [Ferruginibacter sp.]HRQ21451.1 hypothetical protein [Ferruginibacter sp.]
MKKVYGLFLFCAIGFSAQAQVAEEAALPMPTEGTEKKMIDKQAAQTLSQEEQGLTEAEVKAKRTQQRNMDTKRKQIMQNTKMSEKERLKALEELDVEQREASQKRGNATPVLKPLETDNLKND